MIGAKSTIHPVEVPNVSLLLRSLVLSVGFMPVVVRAGDPTPKVVAVWPSGPLEVRVAFDRPADPGLPATLVGTKISFGDTVKPGQPVKTSALTDPKDPTRGTMRVTGATLADDGRTLVLATDPHPRDTRYAFSLPTEPRPVDLAYDLTGVEVTWDDGQPGSEPAWRGWWPALNAERARGKLAGSEPDVELATLLGRPGRLTLHTLVALPKGKPSLVVSASGPFEMSLFGDSAQSKADPKGGQSAELATESTGEPTDLTIVVTTGEKAPFTLDALVKASPEAVPVAPINRGLILPWAPPLPVALPTTEVAESAYVGGDPKKGEAVFLSENAKCATCHQFRGKGKAVGPALDELPSRDKGWIYRQIAEPSATIHPEYLPYTVLFKDGRVAAGVVRGDGTEKVSVTDTEAKSNVFPKAEIEEMRPSNTSIMPVGLIGAIGEQGVRDLIAYLTSPAGK